MTTMGCPTADSAHSRMLLLLLSVDIFGSLLGIFANTTARLRHDVGVISSGIFCAVALTWMPQIAGW